ncbi:Hypothetical protein, putative [Bodo saltans]|uniref:Uncharacterized protein n=1 Tax=Bodo saltans TaxID=75058 RepID=A0A0S4JLE7_BODSA|nr:Hypothetical protein, putative [Bodo saltans]|eukprot:CUG90974.1 Hypothetical protein, putative [Bodo saltans]
MSDGSVVPISRSRIVFVHWTTFRNIDWVLINSTVKAVDLELRVRFPEPAGVDKQSVFVEKRTFSHRSPHKQFRGYRPEVWSVIKLVAAKNNLTLDVVDLGSLTFAQQWNTLHKRKYMIVTEGSFSVWIPFLRRGTVCLMIYDHYGNGRHIPRVHLPLALLGDRKMKMVFVSIFNSSIPTEEVLTTALLLGDPSPQVSVLTVPYDAAVQRLSHFSV